MTEPTEPTSSPSSPSFLEKTQTRIRGWVAQGQNAAQSAGKVSLSPQAILERLEKTRKWLTSGSAQSLIAATTVLCSTYFLADVTALLSESLIPPAPPVRGGGAFGSGSSRIQEDDSVIWSRNLVSSKGALPGEEGGQPLTDPGGAPIKTSLPFQLVGTLILRDELRSIATIEDRSAQQVYPVRVEDEIPGKAKILSIESHKVIFLNPSSGRREYVDLPENTVAGGARITIQSAAPAGGKAAGGGVEKLSATQFNVARTEIDRALGDLNQVLTQARAVPHFENGVPAGYKLFQIVPGSIYEKLGLQNGDLLCGINGSAMTDPGKAFEMLGELKTASHLELCVKRDGRQSNFAYEIR